VRAFFKGNGTNVVKIAPETAIKLTLNDALKRVSSLARAWLAGGSCQKRWHKLDGWCLQACTGAQL